MEQNEHPGPRALSWLEAEGWSQRRLAQESGVATSHLSRYFAGKRGLSRLGAEAISRVMADAYRRGVARTQPLTVGELRGDRQRQRTEAA